jgi:Membrane protein implicated in regulation of membrane protease activity
MEWLTSNFASLLIGTGLVLLAIEVAVLNLSIMILLFIGIACLCTGLLMWIGILPPTWIAACGSVALLSIASAWFLWEPLKRLQQGSSDTAVKNDLVGYRFLLEQSVSNTEFGKHRYSGIDWKVRSEEPLPTGILVEVVKVEVGFLVVAPVEAL